jgi:cell division transport system permease protein
MRHRLEERSSIGLTSIWSEGDGVDRVSIAAIVAHCVRQAIENVRRSVITSLLTLITIAVAIFLLGIFLLGVHNASGSVASDRGDMAVMVFLKDSAGSLDVQTLTKQIQEAAPGRAVTYVDKGQALQYFRDALGEDARMLDGLDADNPLPASLHVQLRSATEADQVYQAVVAKVGTAPKVEGVRYSRGSVQQIKKMLRLVQLVGAVGMIFLFLIAGFIIANTIKLALYNHRIEVEIMQLVGARRLAICMPYLLEGVVQGVLGAGVGLLGVFFVFLLARRFLVNSEVLQAILPTFSFIPTGYILGILLCGALVGVVGSFLAVRKFLAES